MLHESSEKTQRLEELARSENAHEPKSIYSNEGIEKRVGQYQNKDQTSIGQAHMLIYKALYIEDLAIKNEPGRFLRYVIEHMEKAGQYADNTTLFTPVDKDSEARHIFRYMWDKGLSEERCAAIMRSILGADLEEYRPNNMKKHWGKRRNYAKKPKVFYFTRTLRA